MQYYSKILKLQSGFIFGKEFGTLSWRGTRNPVFQAPFVIDECPNSNNCCNPNRDKDCNELTTVVNRGGRSFNDYDLLLPLLPLLTVQSLRIKPP